MIVRNAKSREPNVVSQIHEIELKPGIMTKIKSEDENTGAFIFDQSNSIHGENAGMLQIFEAGTDGKFHLCDYLFIDYGKIICQRFNIIDKYEFFTATSYYVLFTSISGNDAPITIQVRSDFRRKKNVNE